MAKDYKYDHYKAVPDPAEKVNYKKKKPKLVNQESQINQSPIPSVISI